MQSFLYFLKLLLLEAVQTCICLFFIFIILFLDNERYFTELNRFRPKKSDLYDFVNFSINPQVHAFDEFTLSENIKAQSDVVRSAKALSEGTLFYYYFIKIKL